MRRLSMPTGRGKIEKTKEAIAVIDANSTTAECERVNSGTVDRVRTFTNVRIGFIFILMPKE